MTDERIADRIERLVTERNDAAALHADRARLSEIAIELDRCWDVLRQRRALRGAGGDPDDASARDANTVESYLQ